MASFKDFDTAQSAAFYQFLSDSQQKLFDQYVALQLEYRQRHGFSQTYVEAGIEHKWICSQQPELDQFMTYFAGLTMQILNSGHDGASMPDSF